MAIGSMVMVNGKYLGTVIKWCQARNQYLVDVFEIGVTQYVSENLLTAI